MMAGWETGFRVPSTLPDDDEPEEGETTSMTGARQTLREYSEWAHMDDAGTAAIASFPAPLCRRIKFSVPSAVRNLFETTMELARIALGKGSTPSDCIKEMANHCIEVWSVQDPRADSVSQQVVRRDDGRCCVPGCTCRGPLHSHHLEFRSHGGSDDMDNQASACNRHHLRGVHFGYVKVRGKAPDDLLWELGTCPDGTALAVYYGDVRIA